MTSLRGVRLLAAAAAVALGTAGAAAQAPIVRQSPAAGAVITTKGGEELQFRAENDWRTIVIQQQLVGGDSVRTNDGAVAILFEDRTQVRVGRNSTLLVKDIARGPTGETHLALPRGSIFARAARGGSGVSVDTPAAAAAIRGTDWSLAVDGPKTSLVVVEGEVTLANPQGSVTVGRGEGAEALIGQAPRKITLIDFDGRRQLLLYGELRDTFFDMSPTDLSRREERLRRAALQAKSEASRSAEDWIALAETALSYDGGSAAERALAAAEARPLTPALKARADLVRGFLAARAARWREAGPAFRAALPRLDAERAGTAAYAAWIAEALSDRTRKAPPLPPAARYATGAAGALARAGVVRYAESTQAGIAALEEASRRHPDDVMLFAAKAQEHLAESDEKAAKAAIDRARAIDPDDPYLLTISARYRWTIQSDLDGALEELERALAAAPGSAFVWGDIALLQDDRNAPREAEAAHLKAIELDPANVLYRANYAIFLTNRNQLRDAEAMLVTAEAIDPSGYVALVSRGVLLIHQGKTEEGRDKLLAASAVNPAYAAGLLALAIAQYQTEDFVEAQQALDNAEQFDDDNPDVPLVRSIIAVDEYRADDAIRDAQEALRRRLARGGDFSAIESDRQNGSPLNSAYRFLELDEWGRFYGDRAFDAFEANGYFDQTLVNRVDPFGAATLVSPDRTDSLGQTGVSSRIQGLLLDPLSASSPERRQLLVHSPFFEGAIEGGLLSNKGDIGFATDVTVQAKSLDPVPFAAFLNANVARPDSPFADDRNDLTNATAIIGVRPTAYDNLLFFQTYGKQNAEFRLLNPFALVPLDSQKAEVSNTGAGWSHIFGERNVLQVLVVGSRTEQDSEGRRDNVLFDRNFDGIPDSVISIGSRPDAKQRDLTAAVSHLIGLGDVDVRYGAEGTRTDADIRDRRPYTFFGFPFFEDRVAGETAGETGRAYLDATWNVSRHIKIQGGVHVVESEFRNNTTVCPQLFFEPTCALGKIRSRESEVDPRIGVAVEPFAGHWLRAAYRVDSETATNVTLAPVATVGLIPNEFPQSLGGRTKTLAARWDAEWSAHLFTAAEYQRQKVTRLALGVPEGLTTLGIPKADVDRLTLSANVWLTHGIGLFGSYARTWSDRRDIDFDVSFLPKHFGRVGVSIVHPSMVKLTVAQSFVGKRLDAVGATLDGFTTMDAAVTWETFDKRLVLGLQGLNLFDKRFVTQTAGAIDDIRGQGRTILATARLRL